MLEDEAAKMMVDDPENERLVQIYEGYVRMISIFIYIIIYCLIGGSHCP